MLAAAALAGGTPQTAPFTPLSSLSNAPAGEWVNSSVAPAVNTFYSKFIEVPPGLASMTVQIWDADMGDGGAGETTSGNDSGTGAGVTTTYTLLNPAGGTHATVTCTSGTCAARHNVWSLLSTVANPTAGHWEVRYRGIGTAGNHNSWGIRAHDGDPTVGGVELNVYADNHSNIGALHSRRTHVVHPYVTRGCLCNANDHDADSNDPTSNGNLLLSTRTAAASVAALGASMSANGAWNREVLAGFTTDLLAADYGTWTATWSISPIPTTNNVGFYFSDQFDPLPTYTAGVPAGATIPAQPTASGRGFRMYFPTDGGTRPPKPYVGQAVDVVENVTPNPLVVGTPTRVRISITVTNPTNRPIVFSTPSNVVRSRVPVPPGPHTLTYQGVDTMTLGSIVSDPGIGNNGADVIWNPGTLAANSTAQLCYLVDVTAGSSGARIVVTGTPGSVSSPGTTAQYLDETANATQARATYSFGQLCELAVTQNATPLFVDLISLEAVTANNGTAARVLWETGVEVDNAGFRVLRVEPTEVGTYAPGEAINQTLVASEAAEGYGASYSMDDPMPLGLAENRGYYLQDIDLNGNATLHGPIFLYDPAGNALRTGVAGWSLYQ